MQGGSLFNHRRSSNWGKTIAFILCNVAVFANATGCAFDTNTRAETNALVEPVAVETTESLAFTPTPIPEMESMGTATSPAPTLTPIPLPSFSQGPTEYGRSFDGHRLEVYRLGTGPFARAIIGGIHGGYEWNTVELVDEMRRYLQRYTDTIPVTVTLYIIPCANPDGYAAGTDPIVARMNGNGVDLNRNWDYQWQPVATHGTRPVKAGTHAFSEPETDALRRLIEENDIELVIFYHSAMKGAIFSGAEQNRSATYELAEMLSSVIGYRHQTEGVPEQITTGDAVDWLSAKKGIAAVEIELMTHDSVIDTPEWQQNLDGIEAFLRWSIPPANVALKHKRE